MGHYDKAQILYTDAINCADELTNGDGAKSPTLIKQLSILYANRSIAFLRSELYGYAFDDADRSIQVRAPIVGASIVAAALLLAFSRRASARLRIVSVRYVHCSMFAHAFLYDSLSFDFVTTEVLSAWRYGNWTHRLLVACFCHST